MMHPEDVSDPIPNDSASHDRRSLSPSIREGFILLLAQGYSATRAADALGFSRQAAYKWRSTDPDFAAAWDDAVEQGTDRLEDEAWRRAVGFDVTEDVYFQGEVVGQKTRREYSDKMLEILLKAKRASSFNPAVKIESTSKTEINAHIVHELSTPEHSLRTWENILLYDPRYRDAAPHMLPAVREALAALPEAEAREVVE